MPAKKNLLLCLGLILSGFSYQALRGQSGDGIYTADQAKRGETAYKQAMHLLPRRST